MNTNTLYYFAVGGTGALTVEPLLVLCAAGLGPARLGVILIDADAGNPSLARAKQLVEEYQRVREGFGNPEAGFFRTELIRMSPTESLWTPLEGTGSGGGPATLEGYAQLQRMTGECEDAATLMNLLFSPAQQKEPLREGFRGNPSIGSILMHSIKSSPFFRQFLNSARGDTSASFFVAGSVFGGTGAAAIPVLAEVLSSEGIKASAIGGALVTPYYSLGIPGQSERQNGRLKPDSEVFLRNTAAALPTYLGGGSQYGTLYVIGDDQSLPQPRPVYSAGGPSQNNNPHLVELFAALAAIDFLGRNVETGTTSSVFYTTVVGTQPTWGDLPLGDEQRRQLQAFFVASNFFLQYFGLQPSGGEQQELIEELGNQAWLAEISLAPDFVRTNSAELGALARYFASVWGYLRGVTQNYVSLRLVSFDDQSERKIPTPKQYARAVGEDRETLVSLPRVEKCLAGFSPRQRPKLFGIFGKGGEDQLTSLAEMFDSFNRVTSVQGAGLPGLLQYLKAGTERFVADWFTTPST